MKPEGKSPKTKVCCPGCGRTLGDVFDSIVRQRGRFKAQRNEARKGLSTVEREVEQLREARDALKTARLALAFYAEGHFDHGKRARDDLAALHGLQEGRDAA